MDQLMIDRLLNLFPDGSGLHNTLDFTLLHYTTLHYTRLYDTTLDYSLQLHETLLQYIVLYSTLLYYPVGRKQDEQQKQTLHN